MELGRSAQHQPSLVRGHEDMFFLRGDTHNILRPETVESLFYAYHFTQNETYVQWGMRIFDSFERYAK